MTMRPRETELVSLRSLVCAGLEEDHAREDLTSALAIPESSIGAFEVRNRQPGVPAGLDAVGITLAELESGAAVEREASDGEWCETGTLLARISGPRRSILAAERTFLNLLGVLSGTATLTRAFVEAVGSSCTILDTRKTLPGYRVLQKYAVRCGGGQNHRMHLADGFLLKDNHRYEGLDLPTLVDRARRVRPDVEIVVEVDDIDQFNKVLSLNIDRVLLDNFSLEQIRRAREGRDAAGVGIGLEVSGRVGLERAGELAHAGAEFLSIGALTHSAPVWDVGLDEADGI
jgi:nicotinate-nucleotide pyrophosphorylase (carboxylating)